MVVLGHGNVYWTGLNDRDVEGKWMFVADGSEFDPNEGNTLYRWCPGQPNSYKGPQNCASVLFHDDAGRCLNDEECQNKYFGVCEIRNH